MQPEIRITGQSLCGSSLQCGGVQGFCFASFDMHWPALLTLPYWPGRQSLEYFWNILDNFFYIRDVHSYVRTLYIVIHLFSKIILLLFFWILEMGKHRLNPKKAYHRRIPNLETVTVHRRSDSKRAYRPQAFFLKLSLIAMIKWIKNKSRSSQKLMIYRLDTLLTLDFLVAIPL